MKVSIRNASEECLLECDAVTPVLHQALASGVDLPHECLSGACGSCKASLTRGNVENLWSDAPAWNLLKPGEHLLCQCVPLDDCEFEIKGAFSKGIEPAPAYHRGVIRDLRHLNTDVVAFSVVFEKPVDFLAGQFVALSFDGIEGMRCYSIVNAEVPSRQLDFVIKRKPGGKVSDRLFGTNAAEQPVTCFGPVGKAVFDPEQTGNIICIAGGSGIAGMLSIVARAGLSGHLEHHTADVFFGVRSAPDIFFLPEWTALATEHRRVHVVVALSEEAPGDALCKAYPMLTFEQGMVHEVAARRLANPLSGTTAFVAGPTPAVNAALRVLLMQMKLPAKLIKYDKFA